MSSNEIVLRVIQEPERHDLPYMLVGSYSSNAFGIARSTQDADFVIETWEKSLGPLDLEDFKSVLAVQGENLDFAYIRQWTDQHGTKELFETALKAVREVQ